MSAPIALRICGDCGVTIPPGNGHAIRCKPCSALKAVERHRADNARRRAAQRAARDAAAVTGS